MTDGKRPIPEGGAEEKVCLNCGCDSQQRYLIACEYQDQQLYVCAGCLPILIHGAH